MEPPTPSAKPVPTPRGIHISRGVTLRIPAGGLVIHHGGEDAPRMEIAAVELQLDTCVHWLEIALEHVAAAKSAHEVLLSASANSPTLGDLLDREFKASVQAAVAAATFFEALHSATMERMPAKSVSPLGKQRNGRARYTRVAEQLRRSFGLRKQGTANLRSVLGEIYRFRDEAVHPSASFTQPILHPQLNVGVERRFVMFSFASAHQLVRASLAFSKILPSRDLTKRPKGIQELGDYLLQVCGPLYLTWEELYGPLLDEPTRAL